jgi:tRNA modification GTPase
LNGNLSGLFSGPHSFTGEDSCEFQVHGGSAVIAAMMDALASIDNCRPAEPGEFTKRAFFAGKLNLTEVEGLGDLIHAETEVQRKQALYQASGAQSALYKKWRQEILRSVAHLEAFIDFSEDENIEDGVLEGVMESIMKVFTEINLYLKDGRKGERLRNGVRTVILGEPNVGKSSFLNKICQRPVSIVTNIAGTTRDIIETNYNIAGYPILLADTAGLRLTTTDPIEAEGISRARSYTENADFLIFLVDASDYVKFVAQEPSPVANYTENLLSKLGLPEPGDKKVLFILNKSDLLTKRELEICESSGMTVISCLDNSNIEICVDAMAQALEDL